MAGEGRKRLCGRLFRGCHKSRTMSKSGINTTQFVECQMTHAIAETRGRQRRQAQQNGIRSASSGV